MKIEFKFESREFSSLPESGIVITDEKGIGSWAKTQFTQHLPVNKIYLCSRKGKFVFSEDGFGYYKGNFATLTDETEGASLYSSTITIIKPDGEKLRLGIDIISIKR
jgi:hypothetical protein